MNISERLEEHIARLSVSLEKLGYLVNVISQKLEKESSAMTEQEKELFFYDRDNMRIILDIVNDYIQESTDALNSLRNNVPI